MQFFALSTAIILAALSTRGSADSLSDWSYSCQSYYLSNPVLYASCRKENGQYDNTSINLDQCVTNTNGVLYCGTNGDYSPTCSGCYLSGTALACNCKDDSQNEHSTSIDLSTFNAAKRGDKDKLIIANRSVPDK
ncbi:hypothetical protein SCLCIDRAFT_1212835 [Scleroderma citrinum Foug A]|uniref:Cyanovirin-N domain-containing protein n=1 Tax=Scleroderma citrinum Foug A TaxID=1036808 RepID=A0A0C3AIM9_9AGAM|nr:hypothetical protein SCLCIDRAFT_1212835 [Scleroderma citrinum Foug A]